MTPETVALLTNKEVIAVDQDPAGKQGDRVWAQGPIEVWSRTLADGSVAVDINGILRCCLAEIDFRKLDSWPGEGNRHLGDEGYGNDQWADGSEDSWTWRAFFAGARHRFSL